MKTYVAHASREDRWWLVRIGGVGVTQARNLREAQVMAEDLVEAMTDRDRSTYEVILSADLNSGLRREVDQAKRALEALEALQIEAARKSRAVAKHLVEIAGLTGADAAVVLGISPQRVSQLLRS